VARVSKTYLAALRETQRKKDDLLAAEDLSRDAQARIAALRALEQATTGGAASFRDAVRSVVALYWVDRQWVEILSQVGLERPLLNKLAADVERDWHEADLRQEDETPGEFAGRLVAERLPEPQREQSDGKHSETP
jgi:hypothetical protein